jgi:hypothetical protein
VHADPGFLRQVVAAVQAGEEPVGQVVAVAQPGEDVVHRRRLHLERRVPVRVVGVDDRLLGDVVAHALGDEL